MMMLVVAGGSKQIRGEHAWWWDGHRAIPDWRWWQAARR